MKHIAFYIGSLQKGGAERVFVNLAEYFVANNYAVTIVTQLIGENEYPLPTGVTRIMSDLILEEESKSRILNYIKRIHKLRKIWKEIKPDLILSCIGKNNFQAIESALGLPTKVVVSVVSDPKREYGNSIMRFLTKILFPLADGIVLQTKESKGFFPSYLSKKIVIMQNSINPIFIRPIYREEREKTIISVGRLDKNKNQRLIIQAFAQISKQYPDYQLLLYGEGDQKEILEKSIKDLQLEDKVLLKGMIQDVASAIEKAGIFVLSSYVEGMPNALLEAMALGLPVISTDCPCGGPKEMIQQKENGLLVSVNHREELVEAMKYVLDNPQQARLMGENASKIQNVLDPKTTNAKWQAYFELIMGGKA